MKNLRIDDELFAHTWPEAKALGTNSILVLTGPTASGKTALSLDLAAYLNGEIVCCDSMQIYKGLDIGTAKPTAAEQVQIPHHLIDICTIFEQFSVAQYVSEAKKVFTDIFSRGKTPLLVGGTSLYVSALVENMSFSEEDADLELREKLEAEAVILGKEQMYQRLCMLDPIYAASVHPNNTKRVLRALERILSSGNPLSKSSSLESKSVFDYRVFCISQPRDLLYERINRRVDVMIKEGILDEAQWLLDQNLSHRHTAMQAIGYKELFPYLRGECELALAKERLQINTRQYAKRQLAWYRAKNWPLWLFSEATESSFKRIIKQIKA